MEKNESEEAKKIYRVLRQCLYAVELIVEKEKMCVPDMVGLMLLNVLINYDFSSEEIENFLGRLKYHIFANLNQLHKNENQ